MKPLLLISLLSLLWLNTKVFGQTQDPNQSTVVNGPTQTIRGKVYDAVSQFPIIGAVVYVVGTTASAVTDVNGEYVIKGVPLGRQSIRVQFMGYSPRVIDNLILTSGKSTEANVALEEKLVQTNEVVITANEKGGKTAIEATNEMAFVSARGFSVEETKRYAGSRNDPSRMASNFAGVQVNNDGRNDIIIRGNSPTGMLWRLDGLDIPNPSHFGASGATGGPVTILNNNTLGKSDFFTGAFPAEYGNATSGVFDLSMRQGNRNKREFLGQVGFNGFELGAEGPVNALKRSSYLINYRYSTLGAFKAIGLNFGTGAAVPNYQDLTFKFGFGVGKNARIDLFGIGGISNIHFEGKDYDTTNLYAGNRSDLDYKTSMGVVGVSYLHFFNEKTYGKFTVGLMGNSVKAVQDSLTPDLKTSFPNYRDDTWNTKTSFRYELRQKVSTRLSYLAGVYMDLLKVRLNDSLNVNLTPNLSTPTFKWQQLRNNEGSTALFQAFNQWQYRFSENLTANAGLHYQYFALNKSQALEPRAGLKYKLNDVSSLTAGYGLHSGLQPMSAYYYLTKETGQLTNKNLGFTRSNQFVLGYNRSLGAKSILKVETYYQQLYNVPIESRSSSYSMLNYGSTFVNSNIDSLFNNGKGRNYGVELTLERTYSKGYYFLVTTSLYNSEYQGSDGVWRNTGFNSKWLVNALTGYEYNISPKHVLSFDTKVTMGGGRPYVPFNTAASTAAGRAIYDDASAYSQRFSDYFRLDFKITYRRNAKNISQEWFVDIQNITNHINPFSNSWNTDKNKVVQTNQLGLFPNINYRILF